MTDNALKQDPEPARHLLKTRGDTITFTLTLPDEWPGRAWLRTNLGHIKTIRREITRAITHEEPLLGRDWYDIPMPSIDGRRFQLKLGLCDVGHFEAKCLFLPTDRFTPIWPPGDNVKVNVEPTDTCCANTIYNAFVRQFGPNKDGSFEMPGQRDDDIKGLDESGYTVIPPSGTFRDLIAELDFIIGHLGCRIIQLLPINPTPTTYGRMGRFGSPYASLDFTGIDPALARFDPMATPLEQFIELVDAVHARGGKLILDIAPNHTGWAAELHETHPEWLARDEAGNIEAPGAWGVTWADLARLDYRNKDLWQYMGEVFLTWCRRGVDGFRCDAGYMIPLWAWMYIVSIVRDQYPETIFFLEGLGGKISVTRDILNKAGFDWAYSELFQNYDRNQIEHYLPEPMRISTEDGLMIHYAETHDNNRLAATSTRYAAMRTALCALCAPQGGFGFANGVEWFAAEKINVHDAGSLNWGSKKNQVARISRINRLLQTHPAFFDQTDIRMIQTGGGNALVFLRHHPPSGKRLLILVNLDCENQTKIHWHPDDAGIRSTLYTDLLSEQTIHVDAVNERSYAAILQPGAVYCLCAKEEGGVFDKAPGLPERIAHQRLRAAALEVFRAYYGTTHLGDFDPDAAAADLAADPVSFCRRLNPFGSEHRIIRWQWPTDRRRQVMVPPGYFLMITAPQPFRARIVRQADEGERTCAIADCLYQTNGSSFVLFPPLSANKTHIRRWLKLSVFNGDGCEHSESGLLYLASSENAAARQVFTRRMLKQSTYKFLGANARGAMTRVHSAWSQINSKYDGLLAANLNPDYPEDRQMMLVRCRAWLVFQGYSQDIAIECLQNFRVKNTSACTWHFTIPCGQGQHVPLTFTLQMGPDSNRIIVTAKRLRADEQSDRLPDDKPVRLIIRPDIDDRNFHANTKAYLGPEHQWPKNCHTKDSGFEFLPEAARRLTVSSSDGDFTWEPEWQYMVYLPVEAERGMDPHTDLFSPGYFSICLMGDQTVDLVAAVNADANSREMANRPERPADPPSLASGGLPIETALKRALKTYIVQRGSLHTIIAGYPWFLDWGRDTLIACRGLIAAGYLAEAEAILMQFAAFEEKGTLPNMIRGDDARNRDTSDAPLWFFVACDDLMKAGGSDALLGKSCGRRTVFEVMASIAEGYTNGTPNGIRMDKKSGLIYSPPHFTWMDTNHPAGSPRQGYPIEIQALWHFALKLMARIDNQSTDWQAMAEKTRRSIEERFLFPKSGYLSDCLHADADTSAIQAEADDALRPNQIFAATLGAVADKKILYPMLDACMELLVPGAIRSLADRPVKRPLPIYHDGQLLNDPSHPYQGIYTGDEDTRRKPAYHNGTAWTWIFPSFCEAWALAHGEASANTALSWLSSSILLLDAGCAGQIPEILDGDYPHTQRGCDAQAWGVSELLRVWLKLNNEKEHNDEPKKTIPENAADL